MKLKLTHSQFDCMYKLLQNPVSFFRDRGGDMYDALLATIMAGLFQKFYHKAFIKKQQYKITLAPHEALAFWLYFNEHDFENESFEGNLLNTICAQIHQQHAL